jgi:hypothetical protein
VAEFEWPTDLLSESDVEQKVILPLLTSPLWLNIPHWSVRTKQFLPLADIDKGNHKTRNYSPDFVAWESGLPVLVVEAKVPGADLRDAYREAQLYAQFLNRELPSGQNPARYTIATDGIRLLAGEWDALPAIDVKITDLKFGSDARDQILRLTAHPVLADHARRLSTALVASPMRAPIAYLGGTARLNIRKDLNSFALPLAPYIRSYFEADDSVYEDEILTKGYVSSDQITKYDRIFEDHLRYATSSLRGEKILYLETKKSSESHLTNLISKQRANPRSSGFQLIIGGEGSGKSSFLKRFTKHLLPTEIQASIIWIIINVNAAPYDTSNLDLWVCREFNSEVRKKLGNELSLPMLESIFSNQIKDFDTVWANVRSTDPQRFERDRAKHLLQLLSDDIQLSKELSRYITGDKHQALVVFFDNVDRRDREDQLGIFQTAQFFRKHTETMCVVSLRDETFDRHKSEPPLDAFLTSVHFFIPPPRFYDVVRLRLDLILDKIQEELEDNYSYKLASGPTVTISRDSVVDFVKAIHGNVFSDDRRGAVVFEALTGSDIRSALDMFGKALTSGHLDERAITRQGLTSEYFSIPEYLIIRIVMRGEYLWYSERNSPIKNVFSSSSSDWMFGSVSRMEILYWLNRRRRVTGDNGLNGFFLIGKMLNELELLGLPREKLFQEVEFLIDSDLIYIDRFTKTEISEEDYVKIHASGWMHTNFLPLMKRIRGDSCADCTIRG